MREKILISAYTGEELLELVDNNEPYNEEENLDAYQDELDRVYYENVEEIYSAYGLESWWRENGWTLDRGYGGPNYKEKVAGRTSWRLVWEFLCELGEEDAMLGEILYSPVEINDMIIFFDEFEDDEDDED